MIAVRKAISSRIGLAHFPVDPCNVQSLSSAVASENLVLADTAKINFLEMRDSLVQTI